MAMQCSAEKFAIKSSDGSRIYLEMPHQMVEAHGLAMPPIEHRTQRSPFQHGASYLGFSLQPRTVQFAVHGRGCSRMDMWNMRQDFINLINPLVGRLRIRAEFSDGSVYELHDVAYDSEFDVGTDGQPEPTVQQFGMRFIAFDPIWYRWPAREEAAIVTTYDSIIFDTTTIFPIVFAASEIWTTMTVIVNGNWMAFPTIEITGPLQSPVIENITTNEKLALDYYIPSGEIVTISTLFGNKTITNDNGDNLLGYLDPSSDLATFHLDPDPIADGGVNTIDVTGAFATVASGVSISWFDRFLGI